MVERMVRSHIIMPGGFAARWTNYLDFHPIIMNQADPDKSLPPVAAVIFGAGGSKDA